jgi:DNA-binding NarL/FixJ family response regulator
MASILILEDSHVLLTKLTEALKGRYPEETVLPAKTVGEAQDLLSEFEIQVFILDIFLPDGNGIDFLCDAKTISPDAQAIIMTANPVPELEEHAKDLGVLRFFQKPLDMSDVFDAIDPVLKPGTSSDDSFQASLGGLTPIDIIQLKCLARTTQVMKFTRADGVTGKLHFQRGEIVHAELGDGRSGLDAFNEIVSWKGGHVEESMESIAAPTINQGWEALLMDAVRLIDEAAPVA